MLSGAISGNSQGLLALLMLFKSSVTLFLSDGSTSSIIRRREGRICNGNVSPFLGWLSDKALISTI